MKFEIWLNFERLFVTILFAWGFTGQIFAAGGVGNIVNAYRDADGNVIVEAESEYPKSQRQVFFWQRAGQSIFYQLHLIKLKLVAGQYPPGVLGSFELQFTSNIGYGIEEFADMEIVENPISNGEVHAVDSKVVIRCWMGKVCFAKDDGLLSSLREQLEGDPLEFEFLPEVRSVERIYYDETSDTYFVFEKLRYANSSRVAEFISSQSGDLEFLTALNTIDIWTTQSQRVVFENGMSIWIPSFKSQGESPILSFGDGITESRRLRLIPERDINLGFLTFIGIPSARYKPKHLPTPCDLLFD